MSAIKYLSCILLLLLTSRIYSQIPDTVWTKTIGGPLSDVGNSVKQTTDGGFIIAATTSSFGAGGQDIWLIKTDENGDTLWTKTFGGTGNDRTANVVQTNDNGYAVFGTTNSYGNGGDDFLLWKTDSLGNTEWFKTYGTGNDEVSSEGLQTSDGGFVIVGDYYDQVYRALTVKSDSLGNEIWNKSIRWSSSDLFGNSVQQTNNNEFLIFGTWRYWYSGSYRFNYALIKLSESGDSLFIKTYERVGADGGRIIKKTLDGNFILGGSSAYHYIWLIKVSDAGSIYWSRTIAGTYQWTSLRYLEVIDGSYLITVTSEINDFQILKTDNYGIVQWERMIGGSSDDKAYAVHSLNEEDFVVIGETKSFGAGDSDIWIIKFKYNPPPEITVLAPNGGEHWMMWDTVQVEWTYTGFNSVKIELSLSDGIDWMTIAESVPNTGTFDWFVQAPFTSWYCLMKLSDAGDSTIFDISDTTFTIDMFPAVEDTSGLIPKEFALMQNYPNPFNPNTKIKYSVPNVETRHASSLQMVTLKVYDVLGNEIATLVNEEKQPGIYEVEFNGEKLPTGIFFYQLKAGNFVETKKMVLIK